MRRRYGVAIAAALATAVIVPLVANASPITPAQAFAPQGFFRFCAEAQVEIANIDESVLASKGISITGTIYGVDSDLISSKSAVDTATKRIITTTGVEYTDVTTKQHPKQIRCKMRTAESLTKGAWPTGSENQTGRFVVEPAYGFGSLANGVATSQTDQTCQVINQRTINNVWANLTPSQQASAPYKPGTNLVNAADDVVVQGSDWSFDVAPMTVAGSNLVVRSKALVSPTTENPTLSGFTSARFQGAHYCTLVAPEYLRDVLTGAAAVELTMKTSRSIRVATAASLAVAGITGIVVAGAAPAQAAGVSVPVYCETAAFGTTFDLPQTLTASITAPAKVGAASTIPVSFSTTSPIGLPLALSGASIQATVSVTAKNATTSAAAVSSSTGMVSSSQEIPSNSTLLVDTPIGLNVTLPANTAGDVINYSLSEFRVDYVNAPGGLTGAVMTCSPQAGLVTLASSTSTAPEVDTRTNCIAYRDNFGTTNSSSITNPDLTLGNPNGCVSEQDILAQINAGSLRQDVNLATSSINPNAATIDLGSTPVSTTSVTLTGKMNPVTVTDTRGGTYIWGLTAALNNSNFVSTTGGTGVIPSANATVTARACAIQAGSAPGCFALPGSSVLSSATLLSAKLGTLGTTGSTAGTYIISANINLSVPPFTGQGTYKNILRVTLA